MSTIPARTSISAALYALGELGRRAGCTGSEIAAWRVSFGEGLATLRPDPLSEAKVVFPWRPHKIAQFKSLAESAARFTWMHAPDHALLSTIPFFIVPHEEPQSRQPTLFRQTDPTTVVCNADLISATLWALGRAEEFFPANRDEHGRFPSSASIARRHGFLERPIVDEYGIGFEQALSALWPRRQPVRRSLRLKLTHDIDLTGFPRSIRTTLGHAYPRRMPGALFRDAVSAAGFGLPAYAHAIMMTAGISQARGLHSAFYWQASPRTAFDSGYDVRSRALRGIIAELEARGFEVGAHPGYQTYDSTELLTAEIQRLCEVFAAPPQGGRQHFLRWSPATWRAWERAGLRYDSTVGYADALGFRAGTCVPYHPWLLDEDRESDLLEIPLLVMDCTPVRYMQLTPAQTLQRIGELAQRCAAVGGVFTLLWHNASVIEPPYRRLYPQILDLLAGAHAYDWREDAPTQPRPAAVSPAQTL